MGVWRGECDKIMSDVEAMHSRYTIQCCPYTMLSSINEKEKEKALYLYR